MCTSTSPRGDPGGEPASTAQAVTGICHGARWMTTAPNVTFRAPRALCPSAASPIGNEKPLWVSRRMPWHTGGGSGIEAAELEYRFNAWLHIGRCAADIVQLDGTDPDQTAVDLMPANHMPETE